MLDFIKHLDTKLFLWINGFNFEVLDSVMSFISGKYTWFPLYIFLFYLLYRVAGRNIVYIVTAIVILITVSDQSSVILFKNTIQRLRPCHEETLKALIHLVNNKCGGQFGFISSHACNTMALSVFVFMFMKGKFEKLTMLIFIFPFLVAYSRVYLGVHYPGDVIAGILWGGILGYLFAVLTLGFIQKRN